MFAMQNVVRLQLEFVHSKLEDTISREYLLLCHMVSPSRGRNLCLSLAWPDKFFKYVYEYKGGCKKPP